MNNTPQKKGLTMRNGTKEKIIGATIVLVVILIAASFWMGHVIEQRIRKEVEHANQSGLKVTLVDYRGGIFGATAQTELTLTSPAGEEIRIPFHHKIQHGPLPTLTAAGRIHSELALQSDQLAQIKDVFDIGETSFVVDTTIGWGGSARAHFELLLDKLAFPGDFMPAFGFDGVRVQGNLTTNNEMLNATINIDANQINIEGERKETITQPALALQLNNVNIQALSAFWDRKDQDEEGHPPSSGDDDDMPSFWPLLQHNPSLSIQKLTARWPEGDLTGSFQISYTGKASPPSEKDVSADLQLSLPRALARRLIATRISEQISDELEDGDEVNVDVEKETTKTTDRELARMLTNGLIMEKDNNLTLEATFRKGELTLNGKPKSFIDLLGLAPENEAEEEGETIPNNFFPSFDCANAAGPAEKLICTDKTLSRLDAVLAKNYKALYAALGDQRKRLLKDQRAWVKQSRTCRNASCLIDAYSQRIDELCTNYPVSSGEQPKCER